MNNLFLSYEQSLSLKKLRFDEPCFGIWLSSNWKDYELILEMGMNEEFEGNRNVYLLEGACSAPLYQQAFMWFHKNHNLYSWVEKLGISNEYFYVINPHNLDDYKQGEKYFFKTPEETESALIDKLIEIVKNKSN